jgi:hypothetical protein
MRGMGGMGGMGGLKDETPSAQRGTAATKEGAFFLAIAISENAKCKVQNAKCKM